MISNINRKPIFTSGVASKLIGVNQKTMINYENSGIIKISKTSSGRRMYSQVDLFEILVIRYLIRTKKLSSNGIKQIMKLINEAGKKGCDIYSVLVPEKVQQNFLQKIDMG